MNLTLTNPLSGSIHTLTLPKGSSIEFLEKILYSDLYPEAALHTLLLYEAAADPSEDPKKVTTLVDGMQLLVMVNPHRLIPRIKRLPSLVFFEDFADDRTFRRIHFIRVEFYDSENPHADSDFITHEDLLFDRNHERWTTHSSLFSSLSPTLLDSLPAEQWYPSASLAYASSPLRIPQTPSLLEDIQRRVDQEEWERNGA
jgi:hypothetical protein